VNYFDGSTGAPLDDETLDLRYLDYRLAGNGNNASFNEWLSVELVEGYVCTSLIRCPDSDDGSNDPIIGCGKMTPDVRDDEGFVDCRNCGNGKMIEPMSRQHYRHALDAIRKSAGIVDKHNDGLEVKDIVDFMLKMAGIEAILALVCAIEEKGEK
jgi:hypothetical protein